MDGSSACLDRETRRRDVITRGYEDPIPQIMEAHLPDLATHGEKTACFADDREVSTVGRPTTVMARHVLESAT
jgi:hypothetical protein